VEGGNTPFVLKLALNTWRNHNLATMQKQNLDVLLIKGFGADIFLV